MQGCRLTSAESAGIRDEPKSNECTLCWAAVGVSNPLSLTSSSSALASTPAATGGQRQVVASNGMHWQWVQSESPMGNISQLQDFLGALSHSLILSSLMHPLQTRARCACCACCFPAVYHRMVLCERWRVRVQTESVQKVAVVCHAGCGRHVPYPTSAYHKPGK
jgi:hypothetical protein